ncbi:MAG: hypothetical protein IKT40_06355 [Bacilli bacterium]|nr:hypothetical protein [Bacilli bacterium]
MAYFKLDVYKAEDAIANFKRYKNDYISDLELLYSSLNQVDSSWNDTNTPEFKKIIKKDETEILSYFDNVDVLCNKLENFNDELKKIVFSFGFSTNRCVVKFDDSQVDACIRKLSNIINYLNNALYIINNRLLKSDYKNKNHLYKLRDQLYNAVNIVNEIKSNFEKYINSVSKLLKKYEDQIANVDDLELNVDKIHYHSNVVDLS